MCKRYGFPTGAKWCEHTTQRVLENNIIKILCDVSAQTDHKPEYNKPDIIADNQTRECNMIDMVCPFNT